MLSPKIQYFLDLLNDETQNTHFMERWRMSQDCFKNILAKINHIRKKQFGYEEKVELLIFIYYMAQNNTMRSVVDTFGVPRSTINDCIQRHYDMMMEIMPQVIKLPQTEEELAKVAHEFRVKAKTPIFDQVVGALDGTLIRIEPVGKHKNLYFDRKKRYSINLQLISDSNCQILYANGGCPGSYHDSRAIRESEIFKRKIYPPLNSNYMLLADAGYRNRDRPFRTITPYSYRSRIGGRSSKFLQFS